MINLAEKDIQEIAAYFAHESNNLLFNPDKIADEQKESKEMKELDICWIKRLAREDYQTDMRNQASAIAGKKLANIPFIKKQMELVSNRKMEEVAKKMSMEHRTIQQTFSGLVFYHFMGACNEGELKTLVGIMGDSFFDLPLI